MESDALSLISDGLSEVREGCRLPVRMKNTEDWPKAEVICIKQNKYYVHYVDYNKRLDEWVTEDRLDTRKVEPPTGKDDKSHAATTATTGLNTRKKVASSAATSSASQAGAGAAGASSSVTSSRPVSPTTPAPGPALDTPAATPTTSGTDITGPGVLQHAILKAEKKKKRKSLPSVEGGAGAGAGEGQEVTGEGERSAPRQTGSLAAPGSHDDAITRMKNVEMIELGRHRIRPW